MSPDNVDALLKFEVELTANHPALLNGLESWLALGLISDRQVKAICQRSLICQLPDIPVAEPERPLPAKKTTQTAKSATRPAKSAQPGLVGTLLGRLAAELSIVWLLCLGVFLLVVCSALIAATQWRIFSATGQYLILLAYTVVFWAIGLWASRQPRLALTAKTLRTVSLLLVPINLWAMSSLQLTQVSAGLGMAIALGASLLLAFTSYRTFQFYRGPLPADTVPNPETLNPETLNPATAPTAKSVSPSRPMAWLSLFLFWGLAGLHWVWQGDHLPLGLVYGGTVITTVILGFQGIQSRVKPAQTGALTPTVHQGSTLLNGPRLLVCYGLSLILMRGFVHHSGEKLGLAIALVGALLCVLALVNWRPQRSAPTQPVVSPTAATPATGSNPFGDGPLAAATADVTQPPLQPKFTQLWIVIGRSLMLLGWVMTVATLPMQALGVSGLGLALRLDRLKQFWLRRDLGVALWLGLQLPWLGWRSLPESVKETAIAQVAPLSSTANAWPLLGLAYFPYLILLVAVGDGLARRGKSALVGLTTTFAVSLGLGLALISVFDLRVLALNLIASTVTLLIVTLRRRQRGANFAGWVYGTHGLGVLALFVAVADSSPDLSLRSLLILCFSLTAVELGLSVGRRNPWRRSAWLLGNGLMGLSQCLLVNQALALNGDSAQMLLAFVPAVIFTWITTRPAHQQRRGAYPLAMVTVLLATAFSLGTPLNRLVGLGIATGLMGSLSGIRPRSLTATLTVGLGLGWGASLLQDLHPTLPTFTGIHWYPIGAIACALLWLGWHGLGRVSPSTLTASIQPADKTPSPEPQQPPRQWVSAYRFALNGWGFGLCIVLLIALTGEASLRYVALREFQPTYGLAAVVLAAAGVIRNGRSLNNPALFTIGWATELALAEYLAQSTPETLHLSIANLCLSGISLGLASQLTRRFHPLPISLQVWPVIYAGLALCLRIGHFHSWTGWLTLVAAMVMLEVGRQQRQGVLRAIALMLMSMAWYELALYPMLQAPAGEPADGWVILAGVAAMIMLAYQLLALGLQSPVGQRLRFSPGELRWAAHLHWFIGSGLLFMSFPFVLTAAGEMKTAPIALIVGTAMVLYALIHGRWFQRYRPVAVEPSPAAAPDLSAVDPSLEAQTPVPNVRPGTGEKRAWTWVGIAQLLGLCLYGRGLFPALHIFDNWVGIGAAILASLFYYSPWGRWGWPPGPWRKVAMGLPISTALGGWLVGLNVLNLWVVAGFYGGLAWRSRRMRLSYPSGLLAWLAIDQWLAAQNISDAFAHTLPWGLLLLYIAQVDPRFQQRQAPSQRHWLRLIGTGLMLAVALFSDRWTGIPVGIFSLGAIALGLSLQIRAFLYGGTVALVLNVLNQLVLLNQDYPLTKWMIGMGVGILLIWIAADFERRRDQWSSLAQHWQATLREWE